MSWTNELYRVYELAVTTESGNTMLPISHSTAQAQIEITITKSGEFESANEISKKDAKTIIPVTEDSAARGNGIAPMPLTDKLIYISGDYSLYAEGKHANNNEYFAAYMKQLKDWCESDYSHYAIRAIYDYLSKKELIKDLVGSGIIHIDEKTGKFSDKKICAISQNEAVVRFIVSSDDELCHTWLDKKLYNCFDEYYQNSLTSEDICYANGRVRAVTYKHPAKIRNSGDKAKLISANDEKNFTYRGRFENKEEAISVSYDFSQKMHIALKWLIDRQGKAYDSLTIVTWNSALGFVPEITQSAFEIIDDEQEEYSTIPELSKMLNKKLMGDKAEFDNSCKVMVMGLDAASTGRLSISLYTELSESEFAFNLQKWHEDTAWLRRRYKKTLIDSCSLPEIADCLYGREVTPKQNKNNANDGSAYSEDGKSDSVKNKRLECNDENLKKLRKDTILRLLPCIIERRRIPRDIVITMVNRASNPLSYENEYNHTKIIENACALIRKEYKDYNKGEITMAYDPSCTDRSYLYGCLLAIADKAERDSYDNEKDEKDSYGKRTDKAKITNARRYWNAFSSKPYQTWLIIEKNLEPYLEKKDWIMTKYTKHLNEIMAKLSLEDYADNSKLSPMYLIGYHHYNALLWAGNNENNNEEEK